MFSVPKIANLYGAVGVRQPFNGSYAIVDADNQISRSGLYVTDNPLCKIESLKECQDFADITDTDFNILLKRLQLDSVNSIMTQVFSESDFIDRQLLYTHAQNKVNAITLPSGLVGEWIEVSSDNNVAFEITRIMLDFEGSGDLKIMLFNTSEIDPIESETVTIVDTHQVVELNWKVDNSNGTYKGDYYLGYLTNTVDIGTLKPYARDYNNSNVRSSITDLYLTPFLFADHATETIPDLRLREGFSDAHGMNLDITVYNDYTDQILRNESLFYQAINTQFQIKFIEQCIASLRSNGTERRTADLINKMMIGLEGLSVDGHVKVKGLKPSMAILVTKIKKEVEKLSKGYFGGKIKTYTMS